MPEVIKVKILHLPVKAKWYEMQERGEKTEEYREITPYWYQHILRCCCIDIGICYDKVKDL